MIEFVADDLSTRQTLLIRIRDADDGDAWSEFVGLYLPVVERYARSQGVKDSDIDDLSQEVLKSIASAIKKFDYDPEKGTFRSWVFRVVRSKVAQHFKVAGRQPAQASGSTAVHRLLAEHPSESEELDWDLEYRRQMFRWAAQRVRHEFADNTWAAFWHTAVDGMRPADISEKVEMSVGAIYVAKSRVVARLRDLILSTTGEPLQLSNLQE